MAIKQHGGLTWRAEPFGIDQRIAGALNKFGGRHAGCAQFITDESGGFADVRLVFGKGADAGNAEEGFQAFEKFGAIERLHTCSLAQQTPGGADDRLLSSARSLDCAALGGRQKTIVHPTWRYDESGR